MFLHAASSGTQSNTPAVYAPVLISAKGRSYPEIEMKIDQYNFRNKRLESKSNIGIWKAGLPGEIVYATGKSLTPFKAISVYRVATVIVSRPHLC